MDDAAFDRMIDNNELLEWAQVHGRHRYGTPRAPVLAALHAGRPAILEIDLQGARQVRKSCPDASFVFVTAPSWNDLLHRQAGRGTETGAERARRLATAQAEMAAVDESDHIIVNSDVQTAVQELATLLGIA